MTHSPYTLYYAPDNASLIIRLVLEEMGLPYTTQLVDRRICEQRSPEYLALNPAGSIPCLVTPQGVISETAAILLWLADTHQNMAPSTAVTERGAFLKWLFYTSNTFHANLRINFYPSKFAEGELAQNSIRQQIRREIHTSLTLLDQVASEGPSWLGAPQVSVLDYYLACCLRWCGLYPADDHHWFTLANYPHLAAIAERLETRPATHAAIMAEGLGSKPFTAPQMCNPPEGSAT